MRNDLRGKLKGRKSKPKFVNIPTAVINSPEWAELSLVERAFILDLMGSYSGYNNGDLSCAWKIMRSRGWRSRDTLNRARKATLERGFTMITRHGHRNAATLYAVTFLPIHECKGKLEVNPTRTPPHTWRRSDAN